MKNLKLLLPCIILFLACFETISACVCTGEMQTVSQAFDKAEVVFSGKIIGKRQGKVLFKVERYWKGIRTNRIYLFNGNTDCGANFKKDGKRWLIYASKIQMFDGNGKILERIFSILPCSRTKRFADAEEDLKELGKGRIYRNRRRR